MLKMLKGGLMKMKLRNWVKVVLVILLVIVLGFIMKALNNWNDKQINSCIDGGHSYNWCIRELSK